MALVFGISDNIYREGFGERIKELGRFVGWVVLGIFEVGEG